MKFFKPLDVNFGLKCKCDLIVKNSKRLTNLSLYDINNDDIEDLSNNKVLTSLPIHTPMNSRKR